MTVKLQGISRWCSSTTQLWPIIQNFSALSMSNGGLCQVGCRGDLVYVTSINSTGSYAIAVGQNASSNLNIDILSPFTTGTWNFSRRIISESVI